MLCRLCNKEKDIKLFAKHLSYCRQCDNERAIVYRRSYSGTQKKMYNAMVKNSKDRKMDLPIFSREEFFNWLEANNFSYLYTNYKKSVFQKNECPSVDRLNDYLPYTFLNMRLTTWADNNEKAYSDRRSGKNNKQSIAILVFDSNGNFIRENYSMNEEARQIGCRASHINDVLKNKRKSVRGYKFKYKDEEYAV